MDDTDRQIVEALRADGRMSMRALADRIHVSRASAYARVARLERDGVLISDAKVYAMDRMYQIYLQDPSANMLEVNQFI